MAQKSGVKLVAKNPKAYHEYYIVEKFEAGVELFGTCLLYTSVPEMRQFSLKYTKYSCEKLSFSDAKSLAEHACRIVRYCRGRTTGVPTIFWGVVWDAAGGGVLRLNGWH